VHVPFPYNFPPCFFFFFFLTLVRCLFLRSRCPPISKKVEQAPLSNGVQARHLFSVQNFLPAQPLFFFHVQNFHFFIQDTIYGGCLLFLSELPPLSHNVVKRPPLHTYFFLLFKFCRLLSFPAPFENDPLFPASLFSGKKLIECKTVFAPTKLFTQLRRLYFPLLFPRLLCERYVPYTPRSAFFFMVPRELFPFPKLLVPFFSLVFLLHSPLLFIRAMCLSYVYVSPPPPRLRN